MVLQRIRNGALHLRRFPRWGWIPIGIATAVCLLLVGYATYDGRRVSGRVKLEQVDRLDDVRELVAFLGRLEQIQKWQPSAADPARLLLVAEFAHLPSNLHCKEFSDLLRTTPNAESTLNDTLELLSRPSTNALLTKMRQDNFQAFSQSMQLALEPTIEADKDAAYKAILSQEKSQKLIRRLEIVGPVGEPGKLGQLWRTVFGQSRSNLADWVSELLEIGKHVHRLADWYRSLERTSELAIDVNEQGAGLWFSRHLVGGIDYNGLNSTLNGQLQLRVSGPDSATSLQVIDTGVEINGLGVEPDQLNIAVVKIRHLPAPTVTLDQLSRALSQLGLPRGFSLTNIKSFTEKQRYAVSFTAVSRDLENCRFDWKWSLTGTTLEEVKKALEELPQTARSTYEQELSKTIRYGDWHVRFEPFKQGFSVAKLKLGRDELGFSVSLNEQCRLSWHGMLGAQGATLLLNYLLHQNERLSQFAPLVNLDLETVQLTETNLSGQLRLKSQTQGRPDYTGITWTISPDGLARVNVSKDAIEYLEASVAQMPTATMTNPFTAEQAKQSVKTFLEENYSKLAPSVKVEDVRLLNGLPWLRISMTIGDWPALGLGSYPVASPADGRVALEKALSQETVGSEIRRSWSNEHPRLGRVRVNFQSFDPQEPLVNLGVSTKLAVTNAQLSWEERWSAASGLWESNTSEELLNRILEPQIASLEDSVNGVLQTVASSVFVMKLKVTRNGFGLGHWLKLDPLSIKLDGRLDLVGIPLGAEVKGIKIDSQGLDWPMDVSINPRLTIPAGPIAISDPTFGILLPQGVPDRLAKGEVEALGHITYKLGGKITPPSYGGVDVSGGQVRSDNPWLHFIYLQTEIGGRWNNPRVIAKGSLVAFEHSDLASANFESSLKHLDLRAQVRAGSSNDGWFPQFNGELTMNKDLPVWASAEMTLAGIPLNGWLKYTGENPPRIEGEMNGNILKLGWMKFEAKSDAEFKDPRLIGYIPLFLNGWHLKATVDRPHGLVFDVVKMTASGQLAVRLQFPDVAVVDLEKIKARLAELEKDVSPASKEEVEWLNHPNQKPVLDPDKPAQPAREVPKPKSLGRPEPDGASATVTKRPEPILFPDTGLDIEIKHDSFRIFIKKDNKTIVEETIVELKNDNAQVSKPNETHFLVCMYKDSKRIDLLATNYNGKSVQQIRCSDSKTVESVTIWTDRVRALDLFQFDHKTAEGWSRHGLARRDLLHYYAELVWSNADPTDPVAQDGGYSIRYKSLDPQTPIFELFTWVKEGHLQTLEFESRQYIPESNFSAVRRMVASTQVPGLLIPIAVEPEKGQLAVLAVLPSTEKKNKEKILLYPDLVKAPALTIEMEQMPGNGAHDSDKSAVAWYFRVGKLVNNYPEVSAISQARVAA